MKKYNILLSIFIISFFCCKESEKSENFFINISITNDIDKDHILYLKKQENNLNITLDSTYLKNGNAFFSGNIDQPEVFGIFIENNPQGIFPIIEKGTINIEANINNLKDAKIFGTELNDQLRDYKINAKKISVKMNDLFYEFQKARAENNVIKIENINEKMKSIDQELINYKLEFIKSHPNSFVSSMVLYSLANERVLEISTIEKLFMLLSNDVKKSEFSKNTKILIDINKVSNDSLN